MHVAMILDDAFPPDLRVEREAQALIEAGHEVILVNLHPDAVSSQRYNHNGVSVASIALGPFWRKMSALAYTLPFYHWHVALQIRRALKGESVDVMHVHDLKVARGAWWARPAGCRWLLDLHENRPEIMQHYRHVKSGIGRWLIRPGRWARFERKFIRKADAVVVVTEEAAEWYVGNGTVPRQPFIVVPNYSPRSFCPSPEVKATGSGPKRLLYIGDTGERRGLGSAIAAMDILRDELELELHVLGTGSFQSHHEEDIRARGLEDRVYLHGWVHPTEFAAHLDRAHVGICPIHRNPHHDTTYANKIFQYMSFGLPLLVSDCPAQVRVVQQFDCGRVHKAEDAEDMAREISWMFTDAKRYQAWSKNALSAVAAECNWETAAEQFTKRYASI